MIVEKVIGKRVSQQGSKASDELMHQVNQLNSHEWTTILPFSKLSSGVPETRHHFLTSTDQKSRWTHLRVNVYPDGGLARLKGWIINTTINS